MEENERKALVEMEKRQGIRGDTMIMEFNAAKKNIKACGSEIKRIREGESRKKEKGRASSA